MGKVFFHADDFGVTVEQSKKILDCYENGLLNSVSIIANSKEAAKSYELIRDLVEAGKLRLVAHLNFVEGLSMAPKEKLPHLVDSNGMFLCKYGAMLKLNYSGMHQQVKDEFVAEIRAQLAAVAEIIGSKKLSIDSHQHYLQIPMIWEAMCQVVAEDGYEIEYLRIPVDPLGPVFSTPALLFQVPVINFVKWGLLAFLSPRKKDIKAVCSQVPVFFGMPFTCRMTAEPVEKLLPKYKKIADKKNCDLELMFHPGPVRKLDELMDASQEDLVDFYGSQYRDLEADALKNMSLSL